MIKLKLTRDQARLIDNQWLPYMQAVAWSNLRNNATNYGRYLNSKIVISLLADVHLGIKRKLLGSSVTISLALSEAEASALYVFLMKHPIKADFVYGVNMRQVMCDHLYSELFADMPATHEPPPYSDADYYQFFEEYQV